MNVLDSGSVVVEVRYYHEGFHYLVLATHKLVQPWQGLRHYVPQVCKALLEECSSSGFQLEPPYLVMV